MQTWIIKDYPEELVVTTTCCGIVVILSAIVALIAEGNRKAWILRPNMELVAMFYSVSINCLRRTYDMLNYKLVAMFQI